MQFNNKGEKIGFNTNYTIKGKEKVINYHINKNLKEDKTVEISISDKKHLSGFR